MGIGKKFLSILTGLFLSLLGFMSIICAICMVVISLTGRMSDTSHPSGRIFFEIFVIIVGEIFLAFGIAVWLRGLRCIFGPRGWINKAIDFTWKRTMRFALILGGFLIPLNLILLLLKLFEVI